MYLYIDPSIHNSIHLFLFYSDHEKEFTFEGKNRELLSHIVEILDQEKLSLTDLEGVIVLMGNGGFSSTRIASVVANTLSFALKIPVLGIVNAKKLSPETVPALFDSIQSGVYLSPTYSGEPNIGSPSHL